MIRPIAQFFLPLALGLMSFGAQALVFEKLYQVQVDTQTADQQEAMTLEDAFGIGLGTILVRMTGDADAAGREQYAPLIERARDYLQQFGYVDNHTLSLSFDGRALTTELRALGMPVWGQERPATIVWLAVNGEDGTRDILSAEDASEPMQALIDAASQRGIPIIFPLMDTEDREAVNVSDVRGSFVDTIVTASERYQADAIIIGDARPSQLRIVSGSNAGEASGDTPAVVYRTSWTLLFAGDRSSWRGDLASGVDRAADLFARELAAVDTRDNGRQLLLVKGVDTLDAYGKVSNYLKSLSLVDNLAISRVRGDEVMFSLKLRADPQRLASAIRLSRVLVREQGNDTGLSPDTLVYRFGQ